MRILLCVLLCLGLISCSNEEYGNNLIVKGEISQENLNLLINEMISEIYISLKGTYTYKQKLNSYGIDLEIIPKREEEKICSECGKMSPFLKKNLGGWFCPKCRKQRGL